MAFTWSNWKAPSINPLSKQMGVSLGYIPTPQVIGSPQNAINLKNTMLQTAQPAAAAPTSPISQSDVDAKLAAIEKNKAMYKGLSGGSNRTGNYTTSGTYGSAGSVSRSSGLGSTRK